MAKVSKAYGASTLAAPDKDWRAESDSSTLVSAAEIIGDRIRLKNAMSCFDHKLTSMGRMEKVLMRFKGAKAGMGKRY